jgi:hypothetical protein
MKASLRASLPKPSISHVDQTTCFPTHQPIPFFPGKSGSLTLSSLAAGSLYSLGRASTSTPPARWTHFTSISRVPRALPLITLTTTDPLLKFTCSCLTPSLPLIHTSYSLRQQEGFTERKRKIVPASPSGVVHVKWPRGTDELAPIWIKDRHFHAPRFVFDSSLLLQPPTPANCHGLPDRVEINGAHDVVLSFPFARRISCRFEQQSNSTMGKLSRKSGSGHGFRSHMRFKTRYVNISAHADALTFLWDGTGQ